jgi:hypothetical protein
MPPTSISTTTSSKLSLPLPPTPKLQSFFTITSNLLACDLIPTLFLSLSRPSLDFHRSRLGGNFTLNPFALASTLTFTSLRPLSRCTPPSALVAFVMRARCLME